MENERLPPFLPPFIYDFITLLLKNKNLWEPQIHHTSDLKPPLLTTMNMKSVTNAAVQSFASDAVSTHATLKRNSQKQKKHTLSGITWLKFKQLDMSKYTFLNEEVYINYFMPIWNEFRQKEENKIRQRELAKQRLAEQSQRSCCSSHTHRELESYEYELIVTQMNSNKQEINKTPEKDQKNNQKDEVAESSPTKSKKILKEEKYRKIMTEEFIEIAKARNIELLKTKQEKAIYMQNGTILIDHQLANVLKNLPSNYHRRAISELMDSFREEFKIAPEENKLPCCTYYIEYPREEFTFELSDLPDFDDEYYLSLRDCMNYDSLELRKYTRKQITKFLMNRSKMLGCYGFKVLDIKAEESDLNIKILAPRECIISLFTGQVLTRDLAIKYADHYHEIIKGTIFHNIALSDPHREAMISAILAREHGEIAYTQMNPTISKQGVITVKPDPTTLMLDSNVKEFMYRPKKYKYLNSKKRRIAERFERFVIGRREEIPHTQMALLEVSLEPNATKLLSELNEQIFELQDLGQNMMHVFKESSGETNENLSDFNDIFSIGLQKIDALTDTIKKFQPDELSKIPKKMWDGLKTDLLNPIMIGMTSATFLVSGYVTMRYSKDENFRNVARICMGLGAIGLIVTFIKDGVFAIVEKIRDLCKPLYGNGNLEECHTQMDLGDSVNSLYDVFTIFMSTEHLKKADFIKAFQQFNGADRVKRGISSVFEGVQQLVETIANYVLVRLCGKEPIILVKKGHDDFDKLRGKVLELTMKYDQKVLAATVENDNHVAELYEECMKIARELPRTFEATTIRTCLFSMMMELNNIRKQFSYSNLTLQGTRQETLGILVRSAPGKGKSEFVKQAAGDLAKLHLKPEQLAKFKENISLYVFNYNPEADFWDGIKNTCIVALIDELLQKADFKNKEKSELYLIIQIINNFELQLHMARLEDKERTMFRALYLMCTTNVEWGTKFSSIIENNAFWRRWVIRVELIGIEGDMPIGTHGVTDLDPQKMRLSVSVNQGPFNEMSYKEFLTVCWQEQERRRKWNAQSNERLFTMDEKMINEIKAYTQMEIPEFTIEEGFEDEITVEEPSFALEYWKKLKRAPQEVRNVIMRNLEFLRQAMNDAWGKVVGYFDLTSVIEFIKNIPTIMRNVMNKGYDLLKAMKDVMIVDPYNYIIVKSNGVFDKIKSIMASIKQGFNDWVLKPMSSFAQTFTQGFVDFCKWIKNLHPIIAFMAWSGMTVAAGSALLKFMSWLFPSHEQRKLNYMAELHRMHLDEVSWDELKTFIDGQKFWFDEEQMKYWYPCWDEVAFNFHVEFNRKYIDIWESPYYQTDFMKEMAGELKRFYLAEPGEKIESEMFKIPLFCYVFDALEQVIERVPIMSESEQWERRATFSGDRTLKNEVALRGFLEWYVEVMKSNPISMLVISMILKEQAQKNPWVKDIYEEFRVKYYPFFQSGAPHVTEKKLQVPKVIQEKKQVVIPTPKAEVAASEEIPETQMYCQKDTNLDGIMMKVKEHNTYQFTVVFEEDGLTERISNCGFITFVFANVFFMPAHYYKTFKMWEVDGIIRPPEGDFQGSHIRLTPSRDFPFLQVITISFKEFFKGFHQPDPMRDFAFVKIQNGVAQHKDITSKFMSMEDIWEKKTIPLVMFFPIVSEKRVGHTHSSEAHRCTHSRIIFNRGSKEHIHCQRMFQYTIAAADGDCGALAFASIPTLGGGRIFGIHTAGFANTADGLITVVSKEDVEDAKRFYSQDIFVSQMSVEDYTEYKPSPESAINFFRVIGKVKKAVRGNLKSRLVPSPLYGKWSKPTEKPAHLHSFKDKEGNKVIPSEMNWLKSVHSKTHVDEDRLQDCVDIVWANLERNSKRDVDRRVWNREETLKGSDTDPDITPLNRKRSLGHPYDTDPRFKKPGCIGRQAVYGKDEEYEINSPLALEIEAKRLSDLEAYDKSERPVCLIKRVPKDELRDSVKADKGSTRYFKIKPLHALLNERSYFGAFGAWIYKNRIHNGIAIGMNPYSDEWGILYQKLWDMQQGRDGNCGDLDYSGFDLLLKMVIMWMLALKVNEWYADGLVHSKRRLGMFLDDCHPFILYIDIVYEHPNLLTSGCFLTSYFGSIMNQVMITYAWYKFNSFDYQSLTLMHEYLYFCVQSDDNVYACHPDIEGKFSPKYIQGALKDLNAVVTGADKGSANATTCSIYDLRFLKRTFYHHEDGKIRGPSLMEDLEQTPYYAQSNRIVENTIERVEHVLKELTLHGREVFDYKSQKIIAACREAGISMPHTTFKYWYNAMLNTDLHF